MVMSIESSLCPLIVWLRVLGFHMGVTKSGTDRYSIYLLIVGVAMVLATVVFHSTSFVHGAFRLRANEIGPNGTISTTANLINIGIEHLNFTCTVIIVHSSFFLITLTRGWKALWNTLALIEVRLNLKSTFYDKCRKSLCVGFVLLFAVNSILDYIPTSTAVFNQFLCASFFFVGFYYIHFHVDLFILLVLGFNETIGHRTFKHFTTHYPQHLLALRRNGEGSYAAVPGTQRTCFNRAVPSALFNENIIRTAGKVAQKSHDCLRIGGIDQQMLRPHVPYYHNQHFCQFCHNFF